MDKNPYIFSMVWTVGTVLFIVAACIGFGFLARGVMKLTGRSTIDQENAFAGYFFAAPWIVGFLIFVAFPMAMSLYWSFTNFRIGKDITWIGLDNYVKLVTKDLQFRGSLVNTLFLTVIGLPLTMAVALLLAVLLNQKARGERVFRMAFYLPVILGFNSAVLLCWRLMLNAGNGGVVNQIIRQLSASFLPFSLLNRLFIFVTEAVNSFFLGLNNGNFTLFTKALAKFPDANRVPMWIQTAQWTKMSVILLMIWSCGAMMLIFLAGLNNIPRELQEAAEVDGASPWTRFWKITLPLLSPYIFYNLVVGMISTLQIFEPVYVLFRDNQPIQPSAYSMVYYLYNSTFRYNEIGYGSAISWIVLIIIAAVTFLQFRLQKRWVQYDLF